MTEHTPGPWTKGQPGNQRIYAPDGLSEQSGPVAEAMHRFDPAERAANARLIAAAPEMYDLIADFGDAITNMFEQLTRGSWVDDHGHEVIMNAQMIALKPCVTKAIELRAAIAKATKDED